MKNIHRSSEAMEYEPMWSASHGERQQTVLRAHRSGSVLPPILAEGLFLTTNRFAANVFLKALQGLELSQAIRELIGLACIYSISQIHGLRGQMV
jgi:hypothetical protein